MSGSSSAATARLVALIRAETGNVLPQARHPYVEEIAQRRARALELPGPEAYVRLLEHDRASEEWQRLVPLVTVKESYFFRAPQQFAAFERHLLPRLLAARAGERRLRLWSAASARGEEPSTLALLLADHPALADWDWRVVATDLDPDALATAERGLYGERAVAQVPPRLLERWFTRRGELYELSPVIRRRIDYRRLNLARAPYRVLGEERFDAILLRNVLIYFRRPLQRRVAAEVARHLAPDGCLFLGASETLWQIWSGLEPIDLGDCFAYRLPREEPAAAAHPKRPRRPALGDRPEEPVARPVAPPSRPAIDEPRVPAPGAARRRPAAEAAAPEAPVEERAPPEPPAPDPEEPPSAQALVLRAAAELADDRVDDAARTIAAAREADASEPAVWALEGFLHDLHQRTDEAAAAYRAALYLEPGLYQVRVLLADCLLRLGHRGQGEHQFREVLATLAADQGRELLLLDALPLPGRERAERRCRQALGGAPRGGGPARESGGAQPAGSSR